MKAFDPGVGFVHPMAEDSDLVGVLGDGKLAPAQKKAVRPQKKKARKKKSDASGNFASEGSHGVYDERSTNFGSCFWQQDGVHATERFEGSTSRQSVDGSSSLRDEVHRVDPFFDVMLSYFES